MNTLFMQKSGETRKERTYRPAAFTLVELIVSITILTLIVSILTAVFIQLSRTFVRIRVEQEVVTQLTRVVSQLQISGRFFTLDRQWYAQNPASESGSETLVLINRAGTERWRYRYLAEEQSLGVYHEVRETADTSSFVAADGFAPEAYQRLLTDSYRISAVRFFLLGLGQDKVQQPGFSLVINGDILFPDGGKRTFDLQTAFSSRIY